MILSKEHFDEFVWNDISIQKINEHDILLVLICSNEDGAKKLYSIMATTPYDMKLFYNKGEECTIEIDFIETDFYLRFKTDRTEDWYYPLGWLRTGLVNYVTSGHWITDNQTYMFKPFLKLTIPYSNSN